MFRCVCLITGDACDHAGVLRSIRYMHRISFPQSEKFWIPKHTRPQEFRIADLYVADLNKIRYTRSPLSVYELGGHQFRWKKKSVFYVMA